MPPAPDLGAPPPAPSPAHADLAAAPPPPSGETPFYKTTLFWVGVGAGLGAAVLIAALVTPAAEPKVQTSLGTYRPRLD